MKLTLESIRERFPNPRRVRDWSADGNRSGEYCVTGAYLKAIGRFEDGFKVGPVIESFKQEFGMAHEEAVRAAWAIITPNDSGDFETAWAKLGEALSWGETK